MYEVFNSFKQNSSQNFNKHSSILKNPKKISKSLKPRFQNMKCMKNERIEAYQVKKLLKKLEETLRRRLGVIWKCLGDEEIELSRERSKEMRVGSHEEV